MPLKPSTSNSSLPFSDNGNATYINNYNNATGSTTSTSTAILNIQIENSVVFPGSIVRGFVTLNTPIAIDNVVALRLKIVGKERLLRKKDEWELELERQHKGRREDEKKKQQQQQNTKRKHRAGGLRVTDATGSYIGEDEEDDRDNNNNNKINSDSSSATNDQQTLFFLEESTCVYKQLVTLFGQTKESGLRDTTRVQPGEYVYPFEFALPQNLPCSFHTFEIGFGRGALNTAAMMKELSRSETASVASNMSHHHHNTYNNEENHVILTSYESYVDGCVRHNDTSPSASAANHHNSSAQNITNISSNDNNNNNTSSSSTNNNADNNTAVSAKATIQYYIKCYLELNTTSISAASASASSSSSPLIAPSAILEAHLQRQSTNQNHQNNQDEEKLKARLPFLVIPAVPNRQWVDKCPLSVDRQWDVKKCLGCFGSSGTVNCRVSLDRSVIALDRDSLCATLDFECSGKTEVEKVTMRLISKCRMRIDNQSNHIERLVSVVSDVPVIYSNKASGFSDVGNIQQRSHSSNSSVEGGSGSIFNSNNAKSGKACWSGSVSLTCPLTPALCPPSLATARLQSTYELQFLLDIPGVHDACHSFPIMITYTVDGENLQPAINTNTNVFSAFDEIVRKEYIYNQPSRPVAVPRLIQAHQQQQQQQQQQHAPSSSPANISLSFDSTNNNNNNNISSNNSSIALKKSIAGNSFGHHVSMISKQPEASSSRTVYPAQTCWGKPLLHSNHVQRKLATQNFSRSKSRFFFFADTEWDLPREPLLTARANASETIRQKKSGLSDRASSYYQPTNFHGTMYSSTTGHPSNLTPQTNISLQAPSHRQSMRSDIAPSYRQSMQSDVAPHLEEELMLAVVSSAQQTPQTKSMTAQHNNHHVSGGGGSGFGFGAPPPLTSNNFLGVPQSGFPTRDANSTAITPSSATSGGSGGDGNNNNNNHNNHHGLIISRQPSRNHEDLESDLLFASVGGGVVGGSEGDLSHPNHHHNNIPTQPPSAASHVAGEADDDLMLDDDRNNHNREYQAPITTIALEGASLL